jgi:hypothetical protein
MARGRSLLLGALVGVAAGTGSFDALARSGGMQSGGCSGCHGDGDATISLVSQPQSISPGSQVSVTVAVSSNHGSTVGLFVAADEGSLSTQSGQGLYTVPNGLTHAQPKAKSGDTASFGFGWAAPPHPGAVRFRVWTVVADGNGQSNGDHASDAVFDFVYGCTPQTYYRDHDGDGYGVDDVTWIRCAGDPPPGYAEVGGDCDDNDASVHPGATEYCNGRDDNCNGEIDEDAQLLPLYPDADGDGYYGLVEAHPEDMIMGCVPTQGYAAEPGDCEPYIFEINPGAEEICDLIDNNCDGRIDEGVRPRCGEGWCVRESPTCDPAHCVPGPPREEQCNFLDDDCNGLVDDDAPCPVGEACIAGSCRDDENAPAADADTEGHDTAAGTDAGADAEAGSKGCALHPEPPTRWSALAWLLVAARVGRRRIGQSEAPARH